MNQGTCIFLNSNQEFQVRGAEFKCISIMLVFLRFAFNWILYGMIIVLYAL